MPVINGGLYLFVLFNSLSKKCVKKINVNFTVNETQGRNVLRLEEKTEKFVTLKYFSTDTVYKFTCNYVYSAIKCYLLYTGNYIVSTCLGGLLTAKMGESDKQEVAFSLIPDNGYGMLNSCKV